MVTVTGRGPHREVATPKSSNISYPQTTFLQPFCCFAQHQAHDRESGKPIGIPGRPSASKGHPFLLWWWVLFQETVRKLICWKHLKTYTCEVYFWKIRLFLWWHLLKSYCCLQVYLHIRNCALSNRGDLLAKFSRHIQCQSLTVACHAKD